MFVSVKTQKQGNAELNLSLHKGSLPQSYNFLEGDLKTS